MGIDKSNLAILITPKSILSDIDPIIQDAYRVMKNIMEDPAKREEYISAELKKAELEREFEVCEEKGKAEGIKEGIVKGKAEGKAEGIKEGQLTLLVSFIKEKQVPHGMLVTLFSPSFSDLDITKVENYITQNPDVNDETIVEQALKLMGESSHESTS